MKYFIALIAFVLISGCEQSTDTNELTLPPVTTEGVNILACKIDGEIYISKGYIWRGFDGDAMDGVEFNNDLKNNFYTILSIRTSPQLEELEKSELQIYVPRLAVVNDTVFLSDLYFASSNYSGRVPRTSPSDEYYTTNSHRGKLIILRNDAKVISGTFDFYAYSPKTSKIIHVTEGRFDIEKRNE